ncbi:S8 family serine peptidase [Peribacillus muralis]|uniref:S8 family serine peptidase n=1 Tax=Peribacillus muralis TaxID=264697 RepID=UPI0007100A48|nr:S8 family serine peptidase [Peribacillus muralis]
MGKKKKRTKAIQFVTTAALLGSGILGYSYSGNGTYLPQVKAQTAQTAESILASLTPQQKDSLEKLEVNQATGLQVDPNLDLSSGETISVIVQLKQQPVSVADLHAKMQGKSLSAAAVKSKVNASHQAFRDDIASIFKEEMKQKKAVVQINREYKHAFNGVAMTVPANKVNELLKSQVVQAVYSDMEVKVDDPKVKSDIKKADTSGMAESNAYLKIGKLHEEGFKGKGVKIGVLDTGIDYNHPDLKDAYKGGYDFISNDEDPMETTYDDWKASGQQELRSGNTYYSFHGSHVAGTIAGQHKNDSKYATQGIAPEADLYAYRVLGPYGSGLSSGVIAGIDKSVADGMDIINLSLGASVNDPLYPTSIAINNAVLSGVTAVVAASNAGSTPYSLGSPGTAELALTVGASDVPMTIATVKGTLQAGQASVVADLRLLAKSYKDDIDTWKGKSLPVVPVGLGDVADYGGKDVQGKIALIERGTLTINAKIENAKAKGAAAVIIWNNVAEEGFIPSYLGEGKTFIPAFNVTNEQGKKLLDQAKAGDAAFTFNEIGQIQSEGDQLAGFSSRGPVKGTYDIKPEIVAPGVSIMSTVPSFMQGPENIGNYEYAYQRANGTSMATPHMAGIAALLLQANPKLEPADIKATLMNTADPLKEDYSVYDVGAGRVDPYEAIHSNLQIQVHDTTKMLDAENQLVDIQDLTGALNFGAFVDYGKKHKASHMLTLENKSKTTKTYDVKVNYKQDEENSQDGNKSGIQLKTSPTVTVAGSNKLDTQVSLTIPVEAQKGAYEGYITFTNQKDSSDTYQIPFAFRYLKEGIEDLRTYTPIMSDSDRYEYYAPIQPKATNLIFKVGAPMQRVDAFLVDGKTGKELGFIAGADISGAFEDYYMQLAPLLGYGKYYPFTGNSEFPISDDSVTAPQGAYKIKLVATGKSGKTFSKTYDLYIDNNKPKMELNVPSGVIEYEKGQKAYTLSGTITDREMKEAQAAGIDTDPSKNAVTIYRYTNAYNPGAPDLLPLAYTTINEQGAFSWDIPLDQPVKQVRVLGQDRAGNGLYSEARILTFVEKGTTYVRTAADKKSVSYNETYKNTVSVKNAKNWTGGTFKVSYKAQYLSLGDIKVSPKLEKLGKVSITTADAGKDPSYSHLNVSVKLEGDNVKPINGDMPLFEIATKASEQLPLGSTLASVRVSETKANTKSGDEIQVPSDGGSFVNILPTHSKEAFNLNVQGIKPGSRDMNAAKAQIKATDQDGKEFTGAFEASGAKTTNYYTVDKLPLTSKTLTLDVKIPGHTTAVKTAELGREYKGKWIGTYRVADVRPAYAGDVTGDEVIDILDAIAIETYWETNKRSADINFDGTVDQKDFAFVEQNFQLRNPGVENTPIPKKKYKGKTLQSIKEALKIN